MRQVDQPAGPAGQWTFRQHRHTQRTNPPMTEAAATGASSRGHELWGIYGHSRTLSLSHTHRPKCTHTQTHSVPKLSGRQGIALQKKELSSALNLLLKVVIVERTLGSALSVPLVMLVIEYLRELFITYKNCPDQLAHMHICVHKSTNSMPAVFTFRSNLNKGQHTSATSTHKHCTVVNRAQYLLSPERRGCPTEVDIFQTR
jgi:hypothetical protein